MKHRRILIVEDEEKVAKLIQQGLVENEYEAEIAFDGTIGLRMALSGKFDALILDVNLPGINGFEVARSIRQQNAGLPILMLTAMGSLDDKLEGFDSGADDYLLKPFEFRELLVRIQSLIKRLDRPVTIDQVLKMADLEVNIDTKIVKRAGKRIDLTAKEFALLEYLMNRRNRVVSRGEIAEKVWDLNFDTGTNVIDVYVNFLRNKIDKPFDPKLIQTVIGMGYTMRLPDED
jgi:DNA-binding response OmpR family regulator